MEKAGLGVLLNVDVDGEMGIDVTHLVLEALGDADDQVVDEGPDGTESGNILTVAVVDLDTDQVLLDDGEVDRKMAEVLGELASGALDCDESGLDGDLDYLRASNVSDAPPKKSTTVLPDAMNRRVAPNHPLRISPRLCFPNISLSVGAGLDVALSHWKCVGIAAIGLDVPFSGTSRVSSLWM